MADWPDHIGERYAGSPLKPVALQFAGRRFVGECIITANGLEGGVIYAASAEIREAMADHGEAIVHLDLKPNVPADKLAERLAATPRKQSLSNRLRKGPRLRAPAIRGRCADVKMGDRAMRSPTKRFIQLLCVAAMLATLLGTSTSGSQGPGGDTELESPRGSAKMSVEGRRISSPEGEQQ